MLADLFGQLGGTASSVQNTKGCEAAVPNTEPNTTLPGAADERMRTHDDTEANESKVALTNCAVDTPNKKKSAQKN